MALANDDQRLPLAGLVMRKATVATIFLEVRETGSKRHQRRGQPPDMRPNPSNPSPLPPFFVSRSERNPIKPLSRETAVFGASRLWNVCDAIVSAVATSAIVKRRRT